MGNPLRWGKRSPYTIEAARRGVDMYWENHQWIVRWWDDDAGEWRKSEPLTEAEGKAQVKRMREAVRRREMKGKVW